MPLRRDICLGTLLGLPESSRAALPSLPAQLAFLKRQGYAGVVAWDSWSAIKAAGLIPIGMGHVRQPEDALPLAQMHADEELEFTTLHVGNGFETPAQMERLADAILEASERTQHALHIETHRATMTQDIYRTINLSQRWPELKFTLDFSHWYTGHEMTYNGEFEERLERLVPFFSKVRSFQLRIGDTGRIQRPFEQEAHFTQDHLKALSLCFREILDGGGAATVLSAAPELLPAKLDAATSDTWLCYAEKDENNDRFEEARALNLLVETLWDELVAG